MSLTSQACFCLKTFVQFSFCLVCPPFTTLFRSPPNVFYQKGGCSVSSCSVGGPGAQCFPLSLSRLIQRHNFKCADSSWISISGSQRRLSYTQDSCIGNSLRISTQLSNMPLRHSVLKTELTFPHTSCCHLPYLSDDTSIHLLRSKTLGSCLILLSLSHPH